MGRFKVSQIIVKIALFALCFTEKRYGTTNTCSKNSNTNHIIPLRIRSISKIIRKFAKPFRIERRKLALMRLKTQKTLQYRHQKKTTILIVTFLLNINACNNNISNSNKREGRNTSRLRGFFFQLILEFFFVSAFSDIFYCFFKNILLVFVWCLVYF